MKKTQKIIYGTDSTNNLKGQINKLFDQSGRSSFLAYDFKGNPVYLKKKMYEDYQNIIDHNTSPTLGADNYILLFEYDAMNRIRRQSMPDTSRIKYIYNKAGLPEKMMLKQNGTSTFVEYVSNINYNEKGQRTEIYYANNSKTKYEYDTETFRLTRLLTTRNNGADILQDINYTYDPVGNITQITDAAQQTHYFNNSVIAPTGTYTYDALYRLKTATGRELTSLQLPTHTDFVNNIPMPKTSANAMQNYTQQFQYDKLGNIEQMKSVGNWTRDYYYDFANDRNYLLSHTNGTTEYTYDKHGNTLSMPHLTSMVWDDKDQLKEVTLNASGDKAYYIYDSSGERVRKVIEKTGGIVEERIYLGGYEVYRKTISGTLDFERQTLHFSDGTKKIASIETKTVENGSAISTPVSNIRYQYDNHLGSASLELDENAAIISYEEYHPFGTTSYRSGRTETEVSLKRYKYVGKERDEETGLYYYGARYYAAWVARFVSVDPLQFKYPHYTPYQYAGNKPISYIDLDGLEEVLPEKLNVIILIDPTTKTIKSIENDSIKNKNWNIIEDKNLTGAASKLSKFVGENELDNLVIRSHGSPSGPALVPEGDDVQDNMISTGKIIQSEQLMRYSMIGKHPMADTEVEFKETFGAEKMENLKALAEIMGSVKNNGNIIFSGCRIGLGTFGETAVKAFNIMLEKKFNIYTNQDKSASFRQDISTGKLGMLDASMTIPTSYKSGWNKSYLNDEGNVVTEQTSKSLKLNSSGSPFEYVKASEYNSKEENK